MNNQIISPKGTIIIHDVLSILKNAVIYVLPQFLAIISTQVSQHTEWGIYAQFAGLVISSMIKYVEKLNTVKVYNVK